MTEQEIYVLLQNEAGFQVGDKVKVLFSVPDDHLGWNNSWTSGMNDMIGSVYTVTGINGSLGIYLGDFGYSFPFYCLEKVGE